MRRRDESDEFVEVNEELSLKFVEEVECDCTALGCMDAADEPGRTDEVDAWASAEAEGAMEEAPAVPGYGTVFEGAVGVEFE